MSALLQAFGDLLRPSKQLGQSQHFGNIATTLTIKSLEAGAESTPRRGRFAGMSSAQEQFRLSGTPFQVGAHTSSPRFPANCTGVPSEKLRSAGAVEKPSAGTQGRLSEEGEQRPLQWKMQTFYSSGQFGRKYLFLSTSQAAYSYLQFLAAYSLI